MNPAIAPIPVGPRLTRLFAWAGLWLVWAGAVLADVTCGFRKSRKLHHPPRQIAAMTRFVLMTLLIRATHYVTRIKRRSRAYGPNAYRRINHRRADVGALRKHFRAPSMLARIAKLSEALRNPEKLARAIAKRIMLGSTKCVRIYAPAFVVAALGAPVAVREPSLDSS